MSKSKELTPLEVLGKIHDSWNCMNPNSNGCSKDDFKIIETALMKRTIFIIADNKISDDDLEKLKNQRMFPTRLEQCKIKPLFDEDTEKKLKALEIIKKKEVNTSVLLNCFEKYDLEGYNSCVLTSRGELPLTQKEWDILKEMLLCD